jgi:hypothetical protein
MRRSRGPCSDWHSCRAAESGYNTDRCGYRRRPETSVPTPPVTARRLTTPELLQHGPEHGRHHGVAEALRDARLDIGQCVGERPSRCAHAWTRWTTSRGLTLDRYQCAVVLRAWSHATLAHGSWQAPGTTPRRAFSGGEALACPWLSKPQRSASSMARQARKRSGTPCVCSPEQSPRLNEHRFGPRLF